MNNRIQRLTTALTEKRAVKIIAGIGNFNMEQVLQVVRATTHAGATALDVAARPDIVEAARALTDLPLFASCIHPKNLAAAVEAGADVVEVGNFDALYAQGLFFTQNEVLKIAQETVNLVGDQALVSVTIPGHLSLDTQVKLLASLQEIGVDIIQTEGASRFLTAEPKIKPLSMDEKAAITLGNTRVLAASTTLPVMAASGIGLENLHEAFAHGAAAVGIGSAINKLTSETQMRMAVEAMMVKVATMETVQRPVSRVS